MINLWDRNEKSRTVYPFLRWRYKILALTSTEKIEYQALYWHVLWSLISITAHIYLTPEDICKGYLNMRHQISQNTSLAISKSLIQACETSFTSKLQLARRNLLANKCSAIIKETRGITLTEIMIPSISIIDADTFARFSANSGGFIIS